MCRIFLNFVWTGVLFVLPSWGVVDFEKEVWPILESRCVECHKAPYELNGLLKKPKAGLRLDGAAHIMRGSDDGVVVVVDHPSQSSLYQRVVLPEDDSDHMPPKGEPLTKRQKETLRMWIAQGLDFGTWVGATDGLRPSTERNSGFDRPQAEYLQQFDELASGLNGLNLKILEEIAGETGLFIRPLGVGSSLVEVRVVTEAEKVSDNTLIALKPIGGRLAKLDLRGTGVSDAGCRTIASFSKLVSLNLSGTPITSDGVQNLRGLPNLRSLNLVMTGFSDRGLKHLRTFPKLNRVYFWQSQVTRTEVEGFAKGNKNIEVSF